MATDTHSFLHMNARTECGEMNEMRNAYKKRKRTKYKIETTIMKYKRQSESEREGKLELGKKVRRSSMRR